MLVFDSADLDSAVDCAVDAAWFNQGQVIFSYVQLTNSLLLYFILFIFILILISNFIHFRLHGLWGNY
jgi:NAD-dependent aldehyde dehydrogenases